MDESGELKEPEESYLEVVWEQIFTLDYHADVNIREAWNLPVGIRRWYIQRLAEEREEEKKEAEKKQQGQSVSAGKKPPSSPPKNI